jgi:DNA-directed RNA polymerase subunit RPC12/RpoP
MSKEKQIEEMCEVLRQNAESCNTCSWYEDGLCIDNCELAEDNQTVCETLYNAGYRKQSVGKWVEPAYGELKCSECGIVQEDYPHRYNYCPNCGAKMRKEDKGK